MNFLSNLKLGWCLSVGFGIALLFLVGVSYLGIHGIGLTFDVVDDIYTNSLVAELDLAQVAYVNQRDRVLAMDMILNPDPENIKKRANEQIKNADKLNKSYKHYLTTNLSDDEKKAVALFEPALTAYRDEALIPMRDASVAGKPDEAMAIYKAKITLYPKIVEPLERLLDLQVSQAKDAYDHAAKVNSHTTSASIEISVAAVVVVALIAWLITRSIVTRVNVAVVVAEEVAAGNLTVRVDTSGKDELARLLTAMDGMTSGLIKVVSNVRSGSESVATASAEIALGNNDLSARTERQASALEETAASMEELSAIVRQNADAARQANQLATSASTIAVQGGDVVAQVIETMKDINDSSTKIADIISVIDGIAFQTNILALNAAVEAARAGEQGRGFAVVATEVRSLAGRSAAAAKEIKALIGTSVERVELGTTLVDKAGSTMTEVVSSIRRVTDIMAEISAASNEQASGVSQIGEAVQSMDQVTQQNAALVEEMAAAASSLKGQAQDLVQVVATFKLNKDDQILSSSVASKPVSTVNLVNATKSAMPQFTTGTKSNKISVARPKLALSPVRASSDG